MKKHNDFKLLFDNMKLGVVYQDASRKITEANPAAEKILGINKSEMQSVHSESATWQAIKTDGSSFPENEMPVAQALKTGKVIRNVVMGITRPRSKKQTWINIDAVPVFEDGEKKPSQVIVTFSDITEQHELQSQLYATEKKFRALFENGPIGIAYHKMIYDENGKPVDYFFLDANDNYQKLTGVDPRGKLVTEAFPGIEKDPSDWIGTFARAGQKGETVHFQQYLQPVDRWYDAVGYQSSPDHFVAAFFEITEQKKKELELERLKKELEDKVKKRTQQLEIEKENAEAANKAKSAFLANMSHELRTPLNAVLGYADILQGIEKEQAKIQYLNSVSTSGKALLSLINDILDLSKIETGKFDLEHQTVSLKDIVKDIEVIFSQRIMDKGLAWNVEISDDIPQWLLLDEKRIRQVLLNLVGNALKFTDTGSITLKCIPYTEVPSGKGEMHLMFEVHDTGKGIHQDDLDRIFIAFEQAKNQKVSEYGGTGLGLAISKNLAELMEGEIKVESMPGKGSKFTLIIKHIEMAETSDKKQSKTYLDPNTISFEKAYVLVVDDIDYNRDMLGTYLQPYNFDVGFAQNGKEALEMIEQRKPDILLLDMKMPIMTGYELAGLLKNSDEYKDIPIIAITASSLQEDENEIRLNCEGFLRKPVSRAEIVTEMAVFIPYSMSDHQENSVQNNSIDLKTLKIDIALINKIEEKILDGDMDGIIDVIGELKVDTPEENRLVQYITDLALDCNEKELHSIFKTS